MALRNLMRSLTQQNTKYFLAKGPGQIFVTNSIPTFNNHLGNILPALCKPNFYCTQAKPTLTSEDSNEHKKISASEMYDKTIDFSSITNGDQELEKKLRVLCLEHEVLRQEGCMVPQSLNLNQWQEVLNMDSRSKRRKLYKYLFGIEVKKASEAKKKELKAKEYLERIENEKSEDTGHLKYGLNHNNIMLRVYDTTVNNLYNSNLIRAIQFGQKLVIDCGFDDHMTPHETANCAKQLMLTFADNRYHVDPFDVHLCNAHPESPSIKNLHKYIPTMYEDHFPMNIHKASYLDIFPKQDIVYLTPHCQTELVSFDHSAVYIVGAIVDKSNCEPLSLAKAKREGLKMAKLPLDRYLQWGGGSGKSLTLNQMIKILLEIKTSGDWNKALVHVPRRKIVSDNFQARGGQNDRNVEFRWNRQEKKSFSSFKNRKYQN